MNHVFFAKEITHTKTSKENKPIACRLASKIVLGNDQKKKKITRSINFITSIVSRHKFPFLTLPNREKNNHREQQTSRNVLKKDRRQFCFKPKLITRDRI